MHYCRVVLTSLVLLNVSKFEHPVSTALRLSDRFLELLLQLRVRREILASLTVDRCEAVAYQVHINRREWVVGRRGICGVNKSEVYRRAFFVINVGHQFAPIAQPMEAIDCILPILALFTNELHKTAHDPI
jgi:hypothetical protein